MIIYLKIIENKIRRPKPDEKRGNSEEGMRDGIKEDVFIKIKILKDYLSNSLGFMEYL